MMGMMGMMGRKQYSTEYSTAKVTGSRQDEEKGQWKTKTSNIKKKDKS